MQRWRDGGVRARDPLLIRWVMWTLTTNVRLMKDQATLTLHWFGERIQAASYGVVMRQQQTDAVSAQALRAFLAGLENALGGLAATTPTLHFLSRMYAKRIVGFAAKFWVASWLPSRPIPDRGC